MALKDLSMADLVERRRSMVEWLRHTKHATKDQRALGAWRLKAIEDEIRRRGGRLGNPAWLNEALTVSWEELEDHVPPVVNLLANGRISAKPYGCGVWGCVLRTVQPGVVVKITNDVTEARFVSMVMQDDRLQLPGIVRYYDIARLPMRYEGRPVYALWREEAYKVGKVIPDDRAKRNQDQAAFGQHMRHFQEFSSGIEDTLKRAGSKRWELLDAARSFEDDVIDLQLVKVTSSGKVTYKGLQRPPALKFAEELQACRVYAEVIAHGNLGQLVGRALADLISAGILLPDAHRGNLGEVERGGRRVIVITDPGRAMPLYKNLSAALEKAA